MLALPFESVNAAVIDFGAVGLGDDNVGPYTQHDYTIILTPNSEISIQAGLTPRKLVLKPSNVATSVSIIRSDARQFRLLDFAFISRDISAKLDITPVNSSDGVISIDSINNESTLNTEKPNAFNDFASSYTLTLSLSLERYDIDNIELELQPLSQAGSKDNNNYSGLLSLFAFCILICITARQRSLRQGKPR